MSDLRYAMRRVAHGPWRDLEIDHDDRAGISNTVGDEGRVERRVESEQGHDFMGDDLVMKTRRAQKIDAETVLLRSASDQV